ncbi:hypothetical protein ABBQ38_012899 [Trebouxia sp. C0009 RCD-2024]
MRCSAVSKGWAAAAAQSRPPRLCIDRTRYDTGADDDAIGEMRWLRTCMRQGCLQQRFKSLESLSLAYHWEDGSRQYRCDFILDCVLDNISTLDLSESDYLHCSFAPRCTLVTCLPNLTSFKANTRKLDTSSSQKGWWGPQDCDSNMHGASATSARATWLAQELRGVKF